MRVLVAHRTPNRVYGVCVVNVRVESQGFEPVNPTGPHTPESRVAGLSLLVFSSSQLAENPTRAVETFDG